MRTRALQANLRYNPTGPYRWERCPLLEQVSRLTRGVSDSLRTRSGSSPESLPGPTSPRRDLVTYSIALTRVT